MSTESTSRILLTVLVASFMAGLGWWALLGLPWLALVIWLAGALVLGWLWWPVVARRLRKR